MKVLLPGIPSRGASGPKSSLTTTPSFLDRLDRESAFPTLLERNTPHRSSIRADVATLSTDSSCSGTSLSSEVRPLCRDDFEVLELLGVGGFGEVKLVRCKQDDRLYAMKVIEKMKLHERHMMKDAHAAQRALAERDIGVEAREWQCPFIISLHATFQTNEKLYYILEHCPGGDLHSLMLKQAKRRFQEAEARFYLAEVVVALVHLHLHDTIHCDVKLENVLVDGEGHVRLADFGCAKQFSKANEEDPNSGSEVGYSSIMMPPEVESGQPHGKELDCWQLGVLAFTMLSGCWPCQGANWPGTLPSETSKDAGSLCCNLLKERREDRLGFPEGASAVSKHAFFKDIRWEIVRKKELSPPFHNRVSHGLPMRDTIKGSGIRDLLNLRNFSFVRKSLFHRSSIGFSRSSRHS